MFQYHTFQSAMCRTLMSAWIETFYKIVKGWHISCRTLMSAWIETRYFMAAFSL